MKTAIDSMVTFFEDLTEALGDVMTQILEGAQKAGERMAPVCWTFSRTSSGGSIWKCSCGFEWTFERDGDPKSCGFLFCPACGHPIDDAVILIAGGPSQQELELEPARTVTREMALDAGDPTLEGQRL